MALEPLVSIIMNCYNGDRFLKEAIDSVYMQNYQNWEIIFWDNASTDASASIAKSYDNRIKYFFVKRTTSLGEARNLALKRATGKYVAFLDCDDLWLPHKLGNQVEIMEINIEYKMCYGGEIYINEGGEQIRHYLPNASSGNVLKQQLRRYEIGLQSTLIRNNIPLSFSKELEFSPDYELMMRIAIQYKVLVIHDYLIKYRVVEDSLTNRKIHRWWIEMKLTLDRIFAERPELKEIYPKEYRLSYAKVSYYKAQYFYSDDNRKEAISCLSKHKYVSVKYFLLYVLAIFGKDIWRYAHEIKD